MKVKIKTKDLVATTIFLIAILSDQYSKFFPQFVGTLVGTMFVYGPFLVSMIYLFYVLSRRHSVMIIEYSKFFLKLFFPYLLIILFVQILALLFNPTYIDIYGFRYWTRLVSSLITRSAPILLVFLLFLDNRENGLQCLVNAIKIDFWAVFLNVVSKVGVIGALQGMLYPFGLTAGEDASRYFEVHEITFAIGLIILYYLFFLKKGKKEKRDLIILILLFAIGNKRIGFGAFALAAAIALLFKKIITKKTILMIFLIASAFVFLFLYMCYNNEFMAFLDFHNINSMGRDIIWPYFARRSAFSWSYIGSGVSTTAKMLENMSRDELSYMVNVRGIHNDFLKIYFEYGFFGTLTWLAFFLYYIPFKMNKYYGQKSLRIYILCVAYAFVTYLTDNTEAYPLFQATLFLLPLLDANNIPEVNNEFQRID